jgi:hypothetical protein
MDDENEDLEQYTGFSDCGVELGDMILVSTEQGPEIGMFVDETETGIWIKSTHRQTAVKAEVSTVEKAAILCEVEKFTIWELRTYARESGMRWTFNKKREALVDFVFEDLIKSRAVKQTATLTKMQRPVTMFIPGAHIVRVVSYSEWDEEKTLRETAEELVSLDVDKD